jgi:hypothetical protein
MANGETLYLCTSQGQSRPRPRATPELLPAKLSTTYRLSRIGHPRR